MPYPTNKSIWAEAFEMLNQAERLQRQCFRPVARQKPTWEPPVDMMETSDSLLITVALPGVSPERVEVHLSGGRLIVSGTRPLPRPVQHSTRHSVHIHRLELPYGNFERSITLPPGQYELTSHGLLHGCLHLNLNKI